MQNSNLHTETEQVLVVLFHALRVNRVMQITAEHAACRTLLYIALSFTKNKNSRKDQN